MTLCPHLERILDLARWAPSGDNTQPWRFEVLGDEHVLVHGFDTRDKVVYDLDGRASQLALGALLETLVIAAGTEGRQARVERRPQTPETHLLFDVYFQFVPGLAPDPLARYIEKRVVQRRAMSTRPLSCEQKRALANSLPEGYTLNWYEGLAQRWRLARFMFDNAKVRLIVPEGYLVHSTIIEWNARYSEDRIPDQAVGVDPLTSRLMRWAMGSWARVEFFNRYLLGHLPPRIQLDFLPGLRCAAHFALSALSPLETVDGYIAAGRALQRFWLTATSLDLYVQPEMTPVIFTRYHRAGLRFTRQAQASGLVEGLDRRLQGLLAGQAIETLFFMGRVGAGAPPLARSLRRPLEQLLLTAG